MSDGDQPALGRCIGDRQGGSRLRGERLGAGSPPIVLDLDELLSEAQTLHGAVRLMGRSAGWNQVA